MLTESYTSTLALLISSPPLTSTASPTTSNSPTEFMTTTVQETSSILPQPPRSSFALNESADEAANGQMKAEYLAASEKPNIELLDVIYDDESETTETTKDEIYYEEDYVEKNIRNKREAVEVEPKDIWGKLVPGACLKGCAFGFYAFSIVSSVVNCLGSSGRIGNLLVNYRCVSNQDKSVTQGLILMLVSLFALIPGPVMFGRIIDSTCLVWTEQCSGRRGNCQLYDQRLFRYYINLTAFFFTGIGVFFDVLVWKLGKNLDLYGEREQEMLQKKTRNGRNPT